MASLPDHLLIQFDLVDLAESNYHNVLSGCWRYRSVSLAAASEGVGVEKVFETVSALCCVYMYSVVEIGKAKKICCCE